MNITCQACHAKYAVPDAKVRGKKVRFRCRGCGNMVLVADALTTATHEAHAAYAAEASLASSQVPYERELRHEAHADVRTTPVQTRAYGTPADSAERNDFADEAITSRRPVDEAPPFARFDQDVSFDATTRKAAVVRKDPSRAKRDLFAYDPAAAIEQAISGARQTEPPPPSQRVLAHGTGERSETSVLFTLAALSGVRNNGAARAAQVAAGAATQSATSRRAGVAANDADASSGLIDLKAMMADAQELPPEAVKSVFPSDPPLGALTTSVATSPSLSRGRRARWIGGAIAVAALALVGIGFATLNASEDTTIAAAVPAVFVETPAPLATPPVGPTPDPAASNASSTSGTAGGAASSAASPLASEVAATSKTKSKGKAGRRSAGKGAHAASKASSAAASAGTAAAAKPAAPPPASDPCHCKGNLMCAMKCAS